MNYINIIEMFANYANLHPGLKRFRSDTLDIISSFTIENESFPIMYVTFEGATVNKNDAGYKYITWTFNTYILTTKIDLPVEETNNILLNVTNNNTNDTQRILNDLFYTLSEEDDIDISSSMSSNYINNYTTSKLSGVVGTFVFDTDYEDDCYMPFTGSIIRSYSCELDGNYILVNEDDFLSYGEGEIVYK